jgi:acyl carrier protein
MSLSNQSSLTPKTEQPIDVFEVVAQALVEECEIPRETITRDSHVIDDLGLDSLAFLDVCYALSVKLNIKVPFEEWVNDVNSGKVDPKEALTLNVIVQQIEQLVNERTSRDSG